MKDLFILVADKNMQFLLDGLLSRIPEIEGTEQFTYEIRIHPHRDPGVYNESDEFMRPFLNDFRYLLVLLDHDGCGHEDHSRIQIETDISSNLDKVGWEHRNSAVCISPELENWIWVNETRIEEAVSWEENTKLYEWLENQGWKNPDRTKPSRPKEAFEAALKKARTPRSSSIYKDISSTASYQQCTDPAFLKLVSHLKTWFQTA